MTTSTTGYGDLTPHTTLGRLITSCAILLGYGIIAFPTESWARSWWLAH